MNSEAEEEETGPTVDSADQDERIAARRIRIQKRIEAQRRCCQHFINFGEIFLCPVLFGKVIVSFQSREVCMWGEGGRGELAG